VQRSQQLAAMFLLGAFLVGGTLGFTVDRVVSERLREPERPASLVDAFAEELELSPGQRAAVDSILTARDHVLDSIIAPVRPRLYAVRDSARLAIATRLTDQQRAKFDAYIQRTRRPD
jgi:hypothetical protein